ncbi:MAG: EAL domain-containing protein [Tissierellales bacterium]
MFAKVLIVDDSATDRLIIQNMLSEYDILTACDGLEALDTLEVHDDIDLVILDLNMPNMNGFQVLSILNTNARYKNIRTIILTNLDEVENEIKGLKMGAVDYIRKPIHMESLRVRIDIHIELLKLQKLYEQQLYDRNLTFNTVFQQAPIGMSISYSSEPHASNKNITIINPTLEKITGRTEEELIRLGWEKITHPDDIADNLKNFEKLQSGELNSYSMEKRYIKPDGSIVWAHIIVAKLNLMNDQKNNHITLTQDITNRKEMEETLSYNYEHDLWTGLFNRRYLEKLLSHDAKLDSMGKRAIIGINMSSVHILTLTYGFHYSQQLIKKATEALISICTHEHQLFNSHENRLVFYVKDYANKRELEEVVYKIIHVLEPVFSSERICSGIGIVEIDEENKDDVEQLLKKLLIASEKAIHIFDKEFGFCFFDKDMETQILREEEIKQELSLVATDPKDGGLYLQYQPIIDLESNQISGFEALARLRNDKLGLVSPLEFIPIAEKTKQIITIGKKVITQAFSFWNKLKDIGYEEISISINVSAIQLLEKDFTKDLYKMIRDFQVNPENICIEITESMLVDNYEGLNRIFGELKTSGIRVALDDFGTGYSSLSRERELNINCLKIDKYFIDKLISLKEEEAITGDIISMAHKLGHCVIAEGVEHEEQRQYLLKFGCDKFQGYLFSKPLDEEAAIEILKNQT